MKKILIILFFIAFVTGNCKATGNSFQTIYDSVIIGQLVPDINIGAIRNYEKSTAKISDFKGKLLILDFWNTTCTSCIAAMPEMERLQNKFNDKIQIILVTQSKDADIKK